MKRFIASIFIALSLVAVAQPADAKTKVSVACRAALDAGDQIISQNADYAGHVSDFFLAVSAAASTAQKNPTLTGVTAFLQAQSAATDALTNQTKDATSKLTVIGAAYHAASEKCRAGK